jgi:hypothetical protein
MIGQDHFLLGWLCPWCGRVWSPKIEECKYCRRDDPAVPYQDMPAACAPSETAMLDYPGVQVETR